MATRTEDTVKIRVDHITDRAVDSGYVLSEDLLVRCAGRAPTGTSPG
jgi:hypothetical protein